MLLNLHSLLTRTFNEHMWSNGSDRKLKKTKKHGSSIFSVVQSVYKTYKFDSKQIPKNPTTLFRRKTRPYRLNCYFLTNKAGIYLTMKVGPMLACILF